MEYSSGSEAVRPRSPRKPMIVGAFVMVAVVLGVVLVVNSRDTGYTRKVVSESGEACIFPFKYGGKTFNACTSYENDRDWCKVAQDGNNMRWAYCPVKKPDPPACDPDELDRLKKEIDDLKKDREKCRGEMDKCDFERRKAKRCCAQLDTCNGDLDKCRDDYGKATKCCSDLDTCNNNLAKCPKVDHRPLCSNGIKSVRNGDALGNSCCPKSCGTCGGRGCGSRPGGAACCDMAIAGQKQCTTPDQTNCWMAPHEMCYQGIRSVGNGDALGGSCCPLNCGACGGRGCDKRPGGMKCCDMGCQKDHKCVDAFDTACHF